jgi:SAM-dependent methyltransferase
MTLRQPIIPAGQLSFICNICGNAAEADLEQVAQREVVTCNCGSTLRFRAVTAALQERLFGKIGPLAQLPKHKEIRGIGMSETGVYCHLLHQKFDYLNTFLDRPPVLDIMDPAPEYVGRFDFVICSDVMEHVPQPVELAFANLRRLLRPGGTLVFTVPYFFGDGVKEHFPNLYSYELRGSGEGTYLVNRNRDGEETIYRDLHFHGGNGSTLEMRLFSLGGAIDLLGEAGFRETKIHNDHLPHWGIVNLDLTSHPITALA